MGSGSDYSLEATTTSEQEAFRLLAERGRNELARVGRVNGQLHHSYWDAIEKNWVD